jgi:deoxycytidine triphosphate deaminase
MSTTFLSAAEIIEAIKNGEILLSYYSVPDPESEKGILSIKERRFLRIDELSDKDRVDSQIIEYFYKSLEPDSMRLHVGPYAMIDVVVGRDNPEFVSKRAEEFILDVKSSGKLLLYPQEFVLLGTNEWIKVSDTIGATLYTNVRNSDIGLSHISTIIDPTWEGVLQIGLTNPTKYTKQLLYLDPICVVRFHRINKQTDEELFERFRKTRPHYGKDWWDLENQPGLSLFPRRKEYSKDGEFRKRILDEAKREKEEQEREKEEREKEKQERERRKKFEKIILSLGLSAIFASLFFVGRLAERLETAQSNSVAIGRLEGELAQLLRLTEQSNLLQTGRQTIVFTPLNTTVSVHIPFERVSKVPPHIIATFDEVPATNLAYHISFFHEDPNSEYYSSAVIDVKYIGNFTEGRNNTYTVKWLMVYRKIEE